MIYSERSRSCPDGPLSRQGRGRLFFSFKYGKVAKSIEFYMGERGWGALVQLGQEGGLLESRAAALAKGKGGAGLEVHVFLNEDRSRNKKKREKREEDKISDIRKCKIMNR